MHNIHKKEIAVVENYILKGPEVASHGKPSHLVVFLHGYGASGNDLIGLSGYFKKTLPHAHFIAPHAPFPFEHIHHGFYGEGYQWFSIDDRSFLSFHDGVETAAPYISKTVDARLKELQLSNENLILVGFSQGCAMALHEGLRRGNCGGVIGFSGGLIGVPPSETGTTPPICLIHGLHDSILPADFSKQAEDSLKSLGVACEAHYLPGVDHTITEEGIALATTFLSKRLGQ